jgi:hypothetical protein
MAHRLRNLIIVGTGLLAGWLTIVLPARAQTIHPWGTNRCPPPGDTLSLLQPQDPAYSAADTFANFLRAHGFAVSCVTRTTTEGLLGVRKAAAFQTDEGPIAVLFFSGAAQVIVEGQKTSRGYHYQFRNGPHRGVGDVLDVDGPLFVAAHGGWFTIAPTAGVAAALQQDMAAQ